MAFCRINKTQSERQTGRTWICNQNSKTAITIHREQLSRDTGHKDPLTLKVHVFEVILQQVQGWEVSRGLAVDKLKHLLGERPFGLKPSGSVLPQVWSGSQLSLFSVIQLSGLKPGYMTFWSCLLIFSLLLLLYILFLLFEHAMIHLIRVDMSFHYCICLDCGHWRHIVRFLEYQWWKVTLKLKYLYTLYFY